jgi:Carboxypeptidase regulatory-like domain
MARVEPQITQHAQGRFLFVIAGILMIGSWLCSNTFGQSRTTCALAGRVEDESGTGLPGATVQILSTGLIGGAKSVIANVEGRFRFAELPPGSYKITVSFGGYKTVQIEKIQLSVGMTAEVPIKMTIYAGEETVEVQGESRAIDSTSSSMPTILRKDYLKNIPTDRDTSHILDLAPGINLESAYGGAEESGNAYQMDGVDISDPQAGAPWSLFNYSLIDEVQLIGLGAPAEYGQFTGVVFNTITKSGGNDFSGSAEFFYTGRRLSATNAESSNLVATIEKYVEGTLQIAGPILNDKLWYFVSAQYLRNESSEGGPIETENDPRLFSKLTWKTSQSGILSGWVEWAHTKITGRNGDAFTPLEATTGEDNPEVVGNLSWNSTPSEDSILTVAWGGYSGNHHFNPQNGFAIPGRVDAQTGFASDNAAQFGILNRSRNQINASLGYYVSNLKGQHDFKFGTEIERSNIHDRFGSPGGVFFSDNEGPEEDPSTGEDDLFTLAFIGGGYNALGINKRISIFAQDSWRITPRITLNPGLRIDMNRGSVPGATVFKTNPLAPRVGFTWDLKGEGQSILRAHYGRYFEALYAAFYYYMDPGAFNPLTLERIFNTSGYRDVISANPGQVYAMDPHIRQPYMDQYILGFDQQLPHGIVLSGTLVYRRNADFIETVSRDGIFVPVQGVVPETGQEITLFDYLNPGTDVLLYTNPAGLNRTYKGIILSAARQLKNWQLQASYVYSKARGNIDNLGFDETGIGANTPFFDGGFLDTPNSLVNAQGRLTHDQTNQVKLQGTYIIPSLHLSLSANYTYHSGDTWTPLNDCLLTDDGNGVIGDGIVDCHEFPQGPVRYFAETRGSQRLPARNEIDLSVQWHHPLGEQELSLILDIFNLNNQKRATEVETFADEELGQPATINFPRNIRLGIAFSW